MNLSFIADKKKEKQIFIEIGVKQLTGIF